ncbi:MAG TPA: PDZ domain-containing protein [Thermoanaerobaculia bacterium]|nr:PDZ domain-containing protein [Thermoanaerobaculia bacterium]
MRSRFLLLFSLLVCVSAALAGENKCNATARECEAQIRQMLSARRYLGAAFADLSPGVSIKIIVPKSPAERAGLRVGDRIIALNARWTRDSSVREFKRQLAAVASAERLTFIVQRGSAVRRVIVPAERYSTSQIDKIVATHIEQSHPSPPEPNP